jgi:hypothetical protein
MNRGAIAAAMAATAIGVAACSGGPSTQAVHGQVIGGTTSAATVASATGAGGGICGGAVEGTQVIVKGPSGTLLATTTLHRDAKATAALGLPAVMTGQGQVGVYKFSTSIPAGNGPYTIDMVGVSSLVVAKRDLGHLQLTCGG